MKTRIAVSLFAVFAFCVFAEAAVKAEYNEAVVGLKKQVRGDSGRYGSHKGIKARNQAKPGPFSTESPVLNDMAALGADVPKEVVAYALEGNLKKTVLEPISKVANICYGFPECFLPHSMEIFKLAELGIVATVALYDAKGRPWSEKAIRATQLLEKTVSWGRIAGIGIALGDLTFRMVEPKSTSLPREMRRNLATAKSLLARNDTQCTGKPLQVMEDEGARRQRTRQYGIANDYPLNTFEYLMSGKIVGAKYGSKELAFANRRFSNGDGKNCQDFEYDLDNPKFGLRHVMVHLETSSRRVESFSLVFKKRNLVVNEANSEVIKDVLQQFAKCPEALECMLGVKLDPDGTTIGGGSVLAGTRRAKTRYCDISVSTSVVTDRDVLSGETYANILLKIKFDCQMWVLGHDSGTISITDAVRDSGCARH